MPVGHETNIVPVAPSTLLVRQIQNEFEFNSDRLAFRHWLRERNHHGSRYVGSLREGQFLIVQAHVFQNTGGRIEQRFGWRLPEKFHSFGKYCSILGRDSIERIDGKDE